MYKPLILQITNVMAVQFNHMTSSYLKTLQLPFNCHPSTTSVWFFNVNTILITIPIIDQCLCPCLRQYAPNMLKRFGISYILLIIVAGILCLYETIGHHALSQNSSDDNKSCMFDEKSNFQMQMSAWLTLLPIFLISFAEILLKVIGEYFFTFCMIQK